LERLIKQRIKPVSKNNVKSKNSDSTVETTTVYDSLWHFAAERQSVLMRRLDGMPPPWTQDPIIQEFKFTNVYRISDRVSQFLVKNVQYSGSQKPEDVVFRTILFKIFNRIETWKLLEEKLGELRWHTADLESIASILDNALARGDRIYSAAYIMPPPQLGKVRKHRNHLQLIHCMMKNGIVSRIMESKTLEQVYETLLSYPSFGPFLAYQMAIDLNYSSILNFSEMDFVVAGPGAVDGISKCFLKKGGMSNEQIIDWVMLRADSEFDARKIYFDRLNGRPLQLIDWQNIFCEIGKYARIAHPEFTGLSSRSRIKQRFQAKGELTPLFLPPKWEFEN
jgi:hypothetical protein